VHQRDRAQPPAGRGEDRVEHRRGRDGHGRLSDAAQKPPDGMMTTSTGGISPIRREL
jgi:hypothetical protein